MHELSFSVESKVCTQASPLPFLCGGLDRETLFCFLKEFFRILKDKSGVDKIIVKKQPYQLLNTNREFFPSFDAFNFHKLVNASS